MEQSFRADLLPPPMRRLVTQNSRPDEQLILSYWHDLLHTTPEQADEAISAQMAAVAARAVPYLLICGTQPPAEVTERIAGRMAGHAVVEVWEGGGHFPHLAHPTRLAQRLAATATREQVAPAQLDAR
jgi:pimeloyl-ACP methyl ester carboxylesterase